MTVRLLEDGTPRLLEDGTERLLESGGVTTDPLLDRALPFDGQVVYPREWRAMADAEMLDGPLRNEGNEFAVTVLDGLSVEVGAGEAIIAGVHVQNVTARTLTCEAADVIVAHDPSPTLSDRIDLVVAGIDRVTRQGYVRLVTGTFAVTPVAPTPTDDSFHVELPIASIYVTAGVTDLTQADVTDLRMVAAPTNGRGGLIGRLSVDADATTTVNLADEEIWAGWTLAVVLRAGRLYHVHFDGQTLYAAGQNHTVQIRDGGLAGPVVVSAIDLFSAGTLPQFTPRDATAEYDEGVHTFVVTSAYDVGHTGLPGRTLYGATQAAVDNGFLRPWLTVHDCGPVHP